MDNTDERIISATIKLSTTLGFERASTKKIAKEAGISEMTLFRRFKTKENILNTIILRQRKSIFKKIDSVMQHHNDYDYEKFMQILGCEVMHHMTDSLDLLMILGDERRRKLVKDNLSSLVQELLLRLSNYFKEQQNKGVFNDVNPDIAAINFMSYFIYIHQNKDLLKDGPLSDTEKSCQEFIRIFIEGTTKRPR